MKYFNIADIAQKVKMMFGENFEISLGSGLWTNEDIYPLTRHLKTDSIWGFHKHKKKDNFAFSANFDFTKNVVKLYVNETTGNDKHLIQKQFQHWLKGYMDKEPFLMFEQYTRSRQISCILWSDLIPMAETYFKYLIKRESDPANGISNIKYNSNYGSKGLREMCLQLDKKVEIADFKKIFKNKMLEQELSR